MKGNEPPSQNVRAEHQGQNFRIVIEKLFQSKRVFESKKMVDDVFFWHTGTHIKMMSRKRDVCIERNVQGGCSVFRGLFGVWFRPSESEGL